MTLFLSIPFVKGLTNSLSVHARYTLTVPLELSNYYVFVP